MINKEIQQMKNTTKPKTLINSKHYKNTPARKVQQDSRHYFTIQLPLSRAQQQDKNKAKLNCIATLYASNAP